MGEVDIGGGVIVPAMMVWTVLALVVTMGLRRLFAAVDLYRIVWHRALFDLAVGLLVLGAIVAVATSVVGPHVAG